MKNKAMPSSFTAAVQNRNQAAAIQLSQAFDLICQKHQLTVPELYGLALTQIMTQVFEMQLQARYEEAQAHQEKQAKAAEADLAGKNEYKGNG